ncbi:MAG: hypothetical protein LBD82_05380, partial [Deltaproteobacteria bacterium]|nr:hypothetical protein [Deltaproteobacteria bacterium]
MTFSKAKYFSISVACGGQTFSGMNHRKQAERGGLCLKKYLLGLLLFWPGLMYCGLFCARAAVALARVRRGAGRIVL